MTQATCHPDRGNESNGLCRKCYVSKRNVLNRVKSLVALGGKCVACGDGNLRVLQIDHINNDGNIEKRKKGTTSSVHPNLLVSGKRSLQGLQLLCANCHHLKSWGTNPYWEEVLAEVTAREVSNESTLNNPSARHGPRGYPDTN